MKAFETPLCDLSRSAIFGSHVEGQLHLLCNQRNKMGTTTYDYSLCEIEDENVSVSLYKQKVLLAVQNGIIDNRGKRGLTVAARASFQMSCATGPTTDTMMEKYKFLLEYANVDAQTNPSMLAHFFVGLKFSWIRANRCERTLIRVIRLICDKMTPAHGGTPMHDALRERERQEASIKFNVKLDYEKYMEAMLRNYPLVYDEIMQWLRYEVCEDGVGDRTLKKRVDELEETVAQLKKTIEEMKEPKV